MSIFKAKTKTKGIPKEEAFELSYLNLSKPETVQYVDKLLVNNSCFFRMYQIGRDSPETRALAILTSKAIEQPFYTEMRTNQQLGYVVWSYPRPQDDTHYLNFLIESGIVIIPLLLDPDHLNSIIYFMLKIPRYIRFFEMENCIAEYLAFYG